MVKNCQEAKVKEQVECALYLLLSFTHTLKLGLPAGLLSFSLHCSGDN
jgi:hypothetical protein